MKNLIVIDNFYEAPEAVRDFALNKAQYLSPQELPGEFAGTESKQSFFSPAVVGKIEAATGERIHVDPRRYSFGVFFKTFAKDERKRTVHVDQSDWTGLIYLSRPQDCEGGTSFYQHIETGWDTIPALDTLHANGYADRADFVDRFLRPQGRDDTKWKTIARISMKFNRMILFRAGEMFHGADGYFGKTSENCRLAQLFFFKTEGAL